MNEALEIWGGVECSIVRIGDVTRNQLDDTGHFDRGDDLELVAGLGIKSIRYPVPWALVERVAGEFDWHSVDVRLCRLRELGIKPIAGFVHHGPGPDWTEVLDPDFAGQLARFARRAAERFPWIEAFTPVNEPLTTARISGLYGLWQPHGTSEEIFLRLLVAQALAVAKSMAAIRDVIPHAQLVQTEDFGRTFATTKMHYQAAYENERRWLGIDLLCGRVGPGHSFWRRLVRAGVDQADLQYLISEPCPPDIIGVDYYLTSDRVLDERLERFAEDTVGSNGIEKYCDVAAYRAGHPDFDAGLPSRLDEIWQRYRLPIAITELHNGSTREEQLRWLIEGWHAAGCAKARGIDIRAVTSWSLFGAVDWNSMLCAQNGYYEPGAFDVRHSPPLPTVLSDAIAALGREGTYDHPALDSHGWWRQDSANVPSPRAIVLKGFGPSTSVLEECCKKRRLEVIVVNAHHEHNELPDDTRAWATIRVFETPYASKSTSFLHVISEFSDDRGYLSLTADTRGDWHHIANAFLDFIVDRKPGDIRVLNARAANQYEFSAAPELSSSDLRDAG